MREHSIFCSRIHLVCIAVSLLICSTSSYGETVEIKTALKFPILSNGKIAGYSTAATGSKVEVLTRNGDKLQVRYRAFEPIWINSSDVIDYKNNDSNPGVAQQDDSTSFDPQEAIAAMVSENTDRLLEILKGKKYPDKSIQIPFDQSIKNFVKSKLDFAIASQKKPQIDKEVERLRRNADVTGRPNLLNPSDRSGQERAQRIRSEADSLETKANQEIAKCEERLESAQVTLSDYLNNWIEAEKRSQERERLAEEKKQQAEDLVASEPSPSSNPLLSQQPDQSLPASDAQIIPKDSISEQASGIISKAKQGNQNAQFLLGSMYEIGKDVQKDHIEAEKWFRFAAEQGHKQAQVVLGSIYASVNGMGADVNQDYSEAVKWFRKANEQNNLDAQVILGVMLLFGKGIQKDEEEAAALFRKAAEKESPTAQFFLGLVYSRGQGVIQDSSEADKWFDLAYAGKGAYEADKLLSSLVVDDEWTRNEKFGLFATLMTLERKTSTRTSEEATTHLLSLAKDKKIPKIGDSFEDCVLMCPLSPKDSFYKNLNIVNNMAVQLNRGFRSIVLPCGDFDLRLTFTERNILAWMDFYLFFRTEKIDISDENLGSAICNYIAPGVDKWDFSWSNGKRYGRGKVDDKVRVVLISKQFCLSIGSKTASEILYEMQDLQ